MLLSLLLFSVLLVNSYSLFEDLEMDDDEYELFDDNDEFDAKMDDEIEEEEYMLQFFAKPIYMLVASKPKDIEQEGLKRIENTLLTFEKQLVELEEVNRQGLIAVDKYSMFAKGMGKQADIAKERVRNGKVAADRSEKIIPKLVDKLEETIKVLPRREQIRLARRFDLRHRFDLCIPEERNL
ncbi:Uncharacterized protein QTN25_001688 [Entamoeba marina]